MVDCSSILKIKHRDSLRSIISLSSMCHKKVLGISRGHYEKACQTITFIGCCIGSVTWKNSYRCTVRLQVSQVKTSVVSQPKKHFRKQYESFKNFGRRCGERKAMHEYKNTGVQDK